MKPFPEIFNFQKGFARKIPFPHAVPNLWANRRSGSIGARKYERNMIGMVTAIVHNATKTHMNAEKIVKKDDGDLFMIDLYNTIGAVLAMLQNLRDRLK